MMPPYSAGLNRMLTAIIFAQHELYISYRKTSSGLSQSTDFCLASTISTKIVKLISVVR